ncbi:VWA domain-containing protein [Geothermobacter hydrogeniphilus]|uniref:VWFA domain-containing protein n=1 Tax=Geothermobacter hydrogeniphilus TaxID=1969733 RepID=A0A1X0Y8W8_9BACT|nr:VWA domain-containing protein [Geothermobacter hydrogeniphilus]ORJ61576.1 hypothetical protein B5V00_05930 [Geothermobacter hydrogeniphilus]
MNTFHFLRPAWFWALPPALALLLWLARRQLRSRSWQTVCDPELLPHLLLGRSVRRANWPLWLLLAGVLLTITALAGPVWRRLPQPLFRQQSALVILFDLSRSMEAADLKPSRYLRARYKIEDLLRQRKEGQTALVVFAADAFTVAPLTSDRHTIEALLKSLEPGLMPAQGSDPARAMKLGVQLLRQAGLKQGRLLLVTDEDRPETALEAARRLHRQGFELAVLGVGTAEGAPIPQPGGGFFKDADGNLVLPVLNGRALQQLAVAGGGRYHGISIDDADLQDLLSGLNSHRLDNPGVSSTARGDVWSEDGVWLLWPLILLVACGFRRGWLLVLPLLLLQPVPAEAFSWQGLWRTPDQQATQLYRAGDYSAAAAQFEDIRWKASALYRAGDFAAAANLLKKLQGADDFYNLGNALAKQGDLSAALQAYRQALKRDPRDTDARFNKDLVEKELKRRRQRQSRQADSKTGRQNTQENTPGGKKQASGGKQGAQQQSPGATRDRPGGEPRKRQSPDSPSRGEKPVPNRKTPGAARRVRLRDDKAAGKDSGDTSRVAPAGRDRDRETAEQRETRLLLQQIPDDPGGLLRRKFHYQYRQRGQQTQTERSW